jgi:two-component system sensor histidine kinase and response regulator WspE
MEDCFVAARDGRIALNPEHVDLLLGGTDLLMRLAHAQEPGGSEHAGDVDACLLALAQALESPGGEPASGDAGQAATAPAEAGAPRIEAESTETPDRSDRVLRVTAESLNRLLGLAGESLVESRRMRPFADSLLRLRRLQHESGRALADLHSVLSAHAIDPRAESALAQARRLAADLEQLL